MQNIRLSAVGVFVAVIFGAALAQNVAQHLLSPDELKKAVPSEFFFAGQKAPTQLRNAIGFETAGGKFTFAALVDASGYSTAIQQKYQGMLVTESKLNIGGSELPPGLWLWFCGRQIRRDECGKRRCAQRSLPNRRRLEASRAA